MASSINNNVNLGGLQEIQELKTFLKGAVFGPNTTYGGQQRVISSNNNYGIITRADESNFYFLLTDKNDATGSWNDLRPFSIDLATGDVKAQIAKFTKAQNGYFKFNNGFKAMWGYSSSVSPAGTITFPTAFASASSYSVICCVRSTTNYGNPYYVGNQTSTNFTIESNGSSAVPVNWIAIGY